MFWMELLYLTPTEDFHQQELILQMVFFLQMLSHINTETDISINRKRLAWQFNVGINQSFVYYFGLSVCPQWTGTNRKGYVKFLTNRQRSINEGIKMCDQDEKQIQSYV